MLLFDKFCQRIEGIRVNKDDGTNRIKYCDLCDVEKTLVVEESSTITHHEPDLTLEGLRLVFEKNK